MPEILYEDNHLIIVNKPAGLLVQGDKTGDITASDLVKQYIKEEYNKPGNVYLGVVHRLDRPVSGILIFAKTSKALERMNAAFREKKVQKYYWAVVGRAPSEEEQILKHYTIKDGKRLKAMIFPDKRADAKACELKYKLIAHSDRYFLLEVKPYTGRYHQIRAQLSYIGLPIKGDVKYGSPRTNTDGGIHLHARAVKFQHPVTKDLLHIKANLPKEDAVWAAFTQLS